MTTISDILTPASAPAESAPPAAAPHVPVQVPATMRLAVANSVDKLDQLEKEWNALYAASPAAAPPLSWRWVREWWRNYGPVYGDGGRGLRIVTVRDGEQLVGVLPLYMGYQNAGVTRMRRLTCLTDGALEFEETCADYLGLLYAPDMEAVCAEIIARQLEKPSDLVWDEFHLPNLRSTSALASIVSRFDTPRYRTSVQKLEGSFTCDLSGGFEGYLARLSSRNRKQARAVLRDAENPGIAFDVAGDAAEAGVFFDQMVELHRKRWTSRGHAGSFSPRHAEFHRSVLTAGAADGTTFIGRLTQDGRPVSVFYGHRAGRNFHCYQQGTDTSDTTRVRSPGIAAALLSIRHAASAGVTLFDFEQGVNPFKERFCTGVCPLLNVRIVRVNLRSVTFAAVNTGTRVIRKIVNKGGSLLSGHPAQENGAAAGSPSQEAPAPCEAVPAKEQPLA